MKLIRLLKNIYHYFQAMFWQAFYGYPDKSMDIYGITGTNGKTTASYLLFSVLAQALSKDKVGMLTTVAFRVGTKETINKTKLTTLPAKRVYRTLKEMKRSGVKKVVLEVTSHALDQNRLAGIKLSGGMILNLTREHLDYHHTMEEYAQAKEKIIKYLKSGSILVGKEDDTAVNKMLDVAQSQGFKVLRFTKDSASKLEISLFGDVNKENAMAVKLLTEAIGIGDKEIMEGIQGVKLVPGRMEWVETGKGFKILIDYAVTPDALESLYKNVKEITPGKVLAILGAAGLRDRGKRPDMAEVVARYADELIITREDPWTEGDAQIFSDLEKGLENTNTEWSRIADRREAIAHLLNRATSGDTVVITGKGAEQGMAMGNEIIDWNDKKVIMELLQELN